MNIISTDKRFLIQILTMNIQYTQSIVYTLSILCFILSLLPITICDLKTRYIPDRYMVLAATIAFIHVISDKLTGPNIDRIFLRLAAALICALPFILLYFLREDIGGADAKLAAICGLFAGFDQGIRILLYGCLLSLGSILIHRLTKKEKDHRYPLLPGICLCLSLYALRLFTRSL